MIKTSMEGNLFSTPFLPSYLPSFGLPFGGSLPTMNPLISIGSLSKQPLEALSLCAPLNLHTAALPFPQPNIPTASFSLELSTYHNKEVLTRKRKGSPCSIPSTTNHESEDFGSTSLRPEAFSPPPVKRKAQVTQQDKSQRSDASTCRSKQYPCSFPSCTKTFSWKWSMQSHARTHLGAAGRIYKCKFCKKGFFTSGRPLICILCSFLTDLVSRLLEVAYTDSHQKASFLFMQGRKL